jgi:hypothetical protein
VGVAVAALGVPLPSELFGLYAASHRAARRGKRNLDGNETAGALPSISCGRLRPDPLIGDLISPGDLIWLGDLDLAVS